MAKDKATKARREPLTGTAQVVPAITVGDVRSILDMRTRAEALAKELEALNALLKSAEKFTIGRLELGAPVAPGCPRLAIKVEERRNVSWRTVFEERLGKPAAETVLAQWPPTTYKRLVIEATA